jgi:hypothetical protein
MPPNKLSPNGTVQLDFLLAVLYGPVQPLSWLFCTAQLGLFLAVAVRPSSVLLWLHGTAQNVASSLLPRLPRTCPLLAARPSQTQPLSSCQTHMISSASRALFSAQLRCVLHPLSSAIYNFSFTLFPP